MKMLKRLFQFSRKFRRAGRKLPTEPQLYSPVDSDEFARLLGSGRLEDLKILAAKLSGTPKVRI